MKQISLTKGKLVIVDDEDFEWLNQWKWFCHSMNYAVKAKPSKNHKRGIIFMHRVIMNCPKSMEIDHIDGNGGID